MKHAESPRQVTDYVLIRNHDLPLSRSQQKTVSKRRPIGEVPQMSLKLKDLVPYFQSPAAEPLREKISANWENPWMETAASES